jgi:hypothetical protein
VTHSTRPAALRETRESRGARPGHALALTALAFIVLATLNSGGYRYGASDQAFYIPAILEQLDPALFPRDGVVLGAQTKLTIIDELVAGIVRGTSLPLPAIFAILYVTALILFAAGAWMIGTRVFAGTWTCVAWLAALSLRHAIARSGTNTLEGYFHPRMLAYALGTLAIAFFLRRSMSAVVILLLAGFVVHPTTAVWFGVWLAVAAAIAEPPMRRWIVGAMALGAALAGWAVTVGPLAGRLVPLDDEWRALLATKDYLFPFQWPAYAWIINLGYLPVIAWLHRRRMNAGLATTHERALVTGSSLLLAIFIGALVLHGFGIALAFQLQPARVFWMFDFLAVLHAVWWLGEGSKVLRPAVLTALIAAFSIGRGLYVLSVAERPAVQLTIPDDDWGRVMAFARTTDKTSGWLAHPLHAILYGTSVRVAGERDVFVEAVKDAAIGMYDRAIAVRTEERLREVTTFDAITEAEARRLAAKYDLDYLVTETQLALPLAFQSGALRVYHLE